MIPEIIIFTGPMFAGKTTMLLNCWKMEILPKYAFKYSNDTRYEASDNENRQIVSHSNTTLIATGITSCKEINSHVPSDVKEICIFLDEGQFFKDIKQWICECPLKNIKKIYISGLDYDIFGNKFNDDFDEICNIANECHTLTAKCYICNDPANYTQFIDNNSLTNINGNILIGGSEQYQPACINHFMPLSK